MPATATVYSGYRRTLFFLPGIISLFIMCIGIIRNNSLVGGRARAESNPGHWAHHALLYMAAECINHSATRAGPYRLSNSSNLDDREWPLRSLSYCTVLIVARKYKTESRDHEHVPFGGGLSSVLLSTYLPNLKSLSPHIKHTGKATQIIDSWVVWGRRVVQAPLDIAHT